MSAEPVLNEARIVLNAYNSDNVSIKTKLVAIHNAKVRILFLSTFPSKNDIITAGDNTKKMKTYPPQIKPIAAVEAPASTAVRSLPSLELLSHEVINR